MLESHSGWKGKVNLAGAISGRLRGTVKLLLSQMGILLKLQLIKPEP